MILNPDQKKASEIDKNSLLVLAGPGTGKTTALVARYVHLVKSGVKPENILCFAFARKAADEIKLRIEKEIKVKIVPAINNKIKVRPIGHVGYVGRPLAILKDSLEESDSLPDEICMLRDGEWWERIHNTPCLDVGEKAMRFQRGEASVTVKITTSESNEMIGECFSDEGRLFCTPRHRPMKRDRRRYLRLIGVR